MDLKRWFTGGACAIALVICVAVARDTFGEPAADLNGRWRLEDAARAPQRPGPGAWSTLPTGPGGPVLAAGPGAPEALTISGRKLTMVRNGAALQVTYTSAGTSDGGKLTWHEPETTAERVIAFRLVADGNQPCLLLMWDGSTARYRRE